MHKRVFIGFVLLLGIMAVLCFADISSCDKIKIQQVKMTGSSYRWGEGTGKTSDQAKEAALNDLVTRIQTIVLAKSSYEIQETEANCRENTTISTNQFSFLRLRGLEYIQTDEDNCSTTWLAFIHCDSLAASFEVQKQKIRELVNEAKHAESQLRIGDALRSYYWASLLTKTMIDTLMLEIDGRETIEPCLALTEYIQKMAQQMKITKAECGELSGSVLVNLQVTYKGRSIKHMDYIYYDGYGESYGMVSNGRDLVELYITPKSPTYTFLARLRYDYPEKMRHHPDIFGLYEAFRGDLIELTTKVALHFPWIPQETNSVPVQIAKAQQPKRREYPVPVEVLSYLKQTNEFLKALTDYEKGNRLIVEKHDWKKLKDRGYDVYLAVVGKDELQGVFSYDGENYTNVRSMRIYQSVNENFQGFYVWIGLKNQRP